MIGVGCGLRGEAHHTLPGAFREPSENRLCRPLCLREPLPFSSNSANIGRDSYAYQSVFIDKKRKRPELSGV